MATALSAAASAGARATPSSRENRRSNSANVHAGSRRGSAGIERSASARNAVSSSVCGCAATEIGVALRPLGMIVPRRVTELGVGFDDPQIPRERDRAHEANHRRSPPAARLLETIERHGERDVQQQCVTNPRRESRSDRACREIRARSRRRSGRIQPAEATGRDRREAGTGRGRLRSGPS